MGTGMQGRVCRVTAERYDAWTVSPGVGARLP